MSDNCPECDTILLSGATKCPCGWKASPKKAGKGSKPFPYPMHICHYQHEGHRCPLPSSAPIGSQWFCTRHSSQQGGIIGGEGYEYWKEIDEILGGNADRYHDHIVGLIRSCYYWGDDGKLCLDYDEMMKKKVHSPAWVKSCEQAIAQIVLSPLEQVARGIMPYSEFCQEHQRDKPSHWTPTPSKKTLDSDEGQGPE